MARREHDASGPVTQYLAADHARLDALLARAVRAPGAFDLDAFGEFRAGLLRHIALEEKILFRAVREAGAGEDVQSRIVAMSFCEPRSCRLQLSS